MKYVVLADCFRKEGGQAIPMVTSHTNFLTLFFKPVRVDGYVRYNERCCIKYTVCGVLL